MRPDAAGADAGSAGTESLDGLRGLTPANPDANRAVYVWRTDGGGRSFSAPVTLVEGIYSDHPWVAADRGQTPSRRNVYVAWGAGASHTALDSTRSTNGGRSFETPRRILGRPGPPRW